MLGDHLRTKMILRGHPACPETAKCLQTAGEKGVDITSELISDMPLGIGPVIQDVDFVTYGTPAIMSYLDDKGFGPSLVHRNGVVRAVMYQWGYAATMAVGPHIGDSVDKDAIAPAFDALNQQLQSSNPAFRGDFICGQFTMADIHWTAYCNLLDAKGAGDVVSSRSAVAAWYEKVKTHPSTSKENIMPFTCVPTAADMSAGTLRPVAINV